MHEVPTERQESELARETYHAMRMVWWGVRGKMQAPGRDVIVGGIRQHKLNTVFNRGSRRTHFGGTGAGAATPRSNAVGVVPRSGTRQMEWRVNIPIHPNADHMKYSTNIDLYIFSSEVCTAFQLQCTGRRVDSQCATKRCT